MTSFTICREAPSLDYTRTKIQAFCMFEKKNTTTHTKLLMFWLNLCTLLEVTRTAEGC